MSTPSSAPSVRTARSVPGAALRRLARLARRAARRATPARVAAWQTDWRRAAALGLLPPVRGERAEDAHFLGWAPPGHFYSPVPARADAERHVAAVMADSCPTVIGVDLDEAGQLAWLDRLAGVADGFPVTGGRYRADNPSFCPGDAVVLQAMLRLLRPRRLVEIGSGWSSAVTLDTNDAFLDGALDVTLIEPYPAVLSETLRPADRDRITLLADPVQGVDPAVFDALGPGDVCFVDSSHVVKTGSDAQYLYGEVLPRLPSGVVVHVHDIFFPFEYPLVWLQEGRAWNEAYVLRAMLSGNAWDVLFWNDYIGRFHHDRAIAALPPLATGAGGSIWLRRR